MYQENITLQRFIEPAFPVDSDEPVSMPAELSSDERFKHSSPAYQSAVLHTTTTESTSDGNKDDGESCTYIVDPKTSRYFWLYVILN